MVLAILQYLAPAERSATPIAEQEKGFVTILRHAGFHGGSGSAVFEPACAVSMCNRSCDEQQVVLMHWATYKVIRRELLSPRHVLFHMRQSSVSGSCGSLTCLSLFCRSPEMARALQLVQRAGWLRAEAQLHHMAGSYQQAIACLLRDRKCVMPGSEPLPTGVASSALHSISLVVSLMVCQSGIARQ